MQKLIRSGINASLALVTLATSNLALSQELDWKLVKTRSVGNGLSCDPNSIQLLQAGGDMSLIFDKMRVELPAGTELKKLTEWGTCHIGLNMTIPKNYYITYASSSVIGGVEKSKGTNGYIDASTYFVRRLPTILDPVQAGGPFGRILHSQRIFKLNEEISEPLFVMNSEKTFNKKNDLKNMCEWTKTSPASIGMLVNLTVVGQRTTNKKSIILSADNMDSHFDLGVKIGKCP